MGPGGAGHTTSVTISVDTIAAGRSTEDGVAALTDALRELARGAPLNRVLASIAHVAAAATGAQMVIVREREPDGALVARVVAAESDATAAELEGSRIAPEDVAVPAQLLLGEDGMPSAVARAGARVGADVFAIEAVPEDDFAATVELYRRGGPLADVEAAYARVAAALATHAFLYERARRAAAGGGYEQGAVDLASAALAAGSDELEAAEQIARLAFELRGVRGASVWRLEPGGDPVLLASHGEAGERGSEAVVRALEAPGEAGAAMLLGEPPVGALEVVFEDGADADPAFASLATRAAVALRRTQRSARTHEDLRRSRTLIEVVAQAHARLSVAHTLETTVERVVDLVGGEVAVYLRENEGLVLAAASGSLAGPHEAIADRLLEVALGPARARGYVRIDDLRHDPRLAGLESAVEETALRSALVFPLAVGEEAIGLLVVYRRRRRRGRADEETLLLALTSQLAAAVQNARMHERTSELGVVLEDALAKERRSARQLRGLFEIAQSFTRSLSLEATLEAVARSVVELFSLDAAAIHLRDERGDELETRSVHVADPALHDAAAAMLRKSQSMTASAARRVLRSRRPILLTRESIGGENASTVLDPFLARGATAAVVPLASSGDVLGTLTLLSLAPTRPLDDAALEAASTIAAQAALAIDNARLYTHQRDFAETMQRSLLPSGLPEVPGLEVGHVYESAAQVDVGGDVYDFLTLDDGRLAVVLGDVTGKGIGAASDMAMAKYAFRALARVDPEPASFLATANGVVAEDIELGKFITMTYLLVDVAGKRVAIASAGHPPARLVRPDGSVVGVGRGGVALGIDPSQAYEAYTLDLEQGATIVLYTDGVVEARRNGELFGEERLDRFLAENAGLTAQELAEGLVAECTYFAGGELGDDCAVVCIRLAP